MFCSYIILPSSASHGIAAKFFSCIHCSQLMRTFGLPDNSWPRMWQVPCSLYPGKNHNLFLSVMAWKYWNILEQCIHSMGTLQASCSVIAQLTRLCGMNLVAILLMSFHDWWCLFYLWLTDSHNISQRSWENWNLSFTQWNLLVWGARVWWNPYKLQIDYLLYKVKVFHAVRPVGTLGHICNSVLGWNYVQP